MEGRGGNCIIGRWLFFVVLGCVVLGGGGDGGFCGGQVRVEQLVRFLSDLVVVECGEINDLSTDWFRKPAEPNGEEDINGLGCPVIRRRKSCKGTEFCEGVRRALIS